MPYRMPLNRWKEFPLPLEMALFSIEVPSLITLLVVFTALFWVLDSMLARLDLYTHIWHHSLFRLGLFISLYAALGLWIFYQNGVST